MDILTGEEVVKRLHELVNKKITIAVEMDVLMQGVLREDYSKNHFNINGSILLVHQGYNYQFEIEDNFVFIKRLEG